MDSGRIGSTALEQRPRIVLDVPERVGYRRPGSREIGRGAERKVAQVEEKGEFEQSSWTCKDPLHVVASPGCFRWSPQLSHISRTDDIKYINQL